MRKTVLFLASCIQLGAFAQPVVTSASFPQVGVAYNSIISDNLNGTVVPVGNLATSANWDYSQMNNTGTQSTEYASTAGDPIAATNFPTATFMGPLFGNMGVGYGESTSSRFQFIGASISFMNQTIVRPLNGPQVIRYAPMSITSSGRNFSTEFKATIDLASIPQLQQLVNQFITQLPGGQFAQGADSIRIGIDTEVDAIVDGYGNVTIPNGQASVIRLKEETVVGISIDIRLVTAFGGFWFNNAQNFIPAGTLPIPTNQEFHTYSFYNNDYRQPILQFTTTPTDSIMTATYIEEVLAVEGQQAVDLAVFPNPTSDVVNITVGDLPTANYKVSVVDVYGRMIQTQNLPLSANATVSYPVKDVAAGIYWLEIATENNVRVASKPLSIQR